MIEVNEEIVEKSVSFIFDILKKAKQEHLH